MVCVYLVSDLSQPPQDFNGEMAMDHFWNKLTEERIARGFVPSKKIKLHFTCV